VTWGAYIPADFPVGGITSERCIELPLAREVMQLDKPGHVLDAGCALNGSLIDDLHARVFHLTQNVGSETAYAHTASPLSYISGDLRDLSLFTTGGFDRTVCVSTLEHVGFDNSTYGGPVERRPETMFKAVKELCRVTKSELLITVPFSEPGRSCEEWRYLDIRAVAHVAKILFNFGFSVDTRFYGRCPAGWYGGGSEPVEADMTEFPYRVNAIVCLRGVRGE